MKTSATVFYEYLLENPGRFVTQEELCRALPEHFPYIEPKNGTTLNRKFGHVVDFINESVEDFPILVITKNRSYKFANDIEAKEDIKRDERNLEKAYQRLANKKRKVKQNNTADLITTTPGSELKFRLTLVSADPAHE